MLFLEGPTRELKTLTAYDDKLAVYAAVKASDLVDKKALNTLSPTLAAAFAKKMFRKSYEIQLSSACKSLLMMFFIWTNSDPSQLLRKMRCFLLKVQRSLQMHVASPESLTRTPI